jgi:hypothetical protein
MNKVAHILWDLDVHAAMTSSINFFGTPIITVWMISRKLVELRCSRKQEKAIKYYTETAVAM